MPGAQIVTWCSTKINNCHGVDNKQKMCQLSNNREASGFTYKNWPEWPIYFVFYD